MSTLLKKFEYSITMINKFHLKTWLVLIQFFFLVSQRRRVVQCRKAISKSQEWWKNTIIYQIYPRSFKDFDGDGIGDLRGIESHLDYLVYLNVGGAWISPIYKSPMKDFGYDISDFKDIDPIFGTIDDFKSLVDTAHYKGLKIIMDFVPNHSSDEHEWFQKSLKREEPYTDYYVWVDPKGFDENGDPIPPSNWVSHFRYSAWQYSEERGQFYLHQYLPQQPDLNYRNPLVLEEMKDVLRFWLDLGVDGFRMDAVVTIWEDDRWLDEPPSGDPNAADENDWLYYNHIFTVNLPETRTILKQFYDTIKEYGDDKLSVLEAWVTNQNDFLEYYKCSDFPFNFNFPNSWGLTGNSTPPYPLYANAVISQIENWINAVPYGKISNWVIGNHDNPRVANRYGSKFIDTLNIMALTLPGTVITYQGEEIGMSDNLNISYFETQDPKGCNCGPERYMECSRDPERTPFQWNSADPTAGFSTNIDAETWLPINSNYRCDEANEVECGINFEDEKYTVSSYLANYKAVSYLRNLGEFNGDFSAKVKLEKVLALSRCKFLIPVWGTCKVTMVNFADEAIMVDIYQDFHPSAQEGLILLSTAQDGQRPNSRIDLKNIILTPYETILLSIK